MPYGTVNADVIQTSTSGGILGAGNASIMKNRIINGAMVIDQRNAGASVTPTVTNTYTLDRWIVALSQSSKFSVQQNAGSVTPPVGFVNYFGATSLSAYTVGAAESFNVRQFIEGYNIADLGWGTANAKTVTLSFWVRSSLTGTFGGCIKNSANDRSYPFTFTISSANTWEYETITIAGDTSGTWLTDNGVGIRVIFSLGTGSTLSGTAGAWAATNYSSATGATSVVGTNGATFYITGVQLEVGSSATGFEYVNYQTSLANCQRYYYKVSASAYQTYCLGIAYGTGAVRFNFPLPTTMRTVPTTYNFSGDTTFLCENGAGSSVVTSSLGSTGNNTPNSIQLSFGVTGATSNSPYFLYSNGTASFIGIGAEL